MKIKLSFNGVYWNDMYHQHEYVLATIILEEIGDFNNLKDVRAE